jgi:hypothetical protein
MTARRAAEIAEACRAYLAAHERRAANAAHGTLSEEYAAAQLVYLIAAPEREDAHPASRAAA